MLPAKAGGIEIYSASDYLETRRLWGTGGLLLHELSHAFHNKHCPQGFACPEILEAFNKAMRDRKYESVCYRTFAPNRKTPSACQGAKPDPARERDKPEMTLSQHLPPQDARALCRRTAKHYACADCMEFFAELSVAYLYDSDYNAPSAPALPSAAITSCPLDSNSELAARRAEMPKEQYEVKGQKQNQKQSQRTRTEGKGGEQLQQQQQEEPFDKHDFNKWWPHNRRQLLAHDPDTCRLLERAWACRLE
jgi:hypothetical protein